MINYSLVTLVFEAASLKTGTIPAHKTWFVKLQYITPQSRILLEKLTGFSQPVNKFPAFYETRRFITAFTSARHTSLFLSQINPLNDTHPTS
jgi:hypothetical protein